MALDISFLGMMGVAILRQKVKNKKREETRAWTRTIINTKLRLTDWVELPFYISIKYTNL